MDVFIVEHMGLGLSEVEVVLVMAEGAIRETLNEKVCPDCRASKVLVASILWDHMIQ